MEEEWKRNRGKKLSLMPPLIWPSAFTKGEEQKSPEVSGSDQGCQHPEDKEGQTPAGAGLPVGRGQLPQSGGGSGKRGQGPKAESWRRPHGI